MATNYYGDPTTSMSYAQGILTDLYGKLNDKEKQRLERVKAREDMNKLQSSLTKTAAMKGQQTGTVGGYGTSNVMSQGLSQAKNLIRDLKISQDEQNMQNMYNFLTGATNLGSTMSGMNLQEDYLQQAKQAYLDSRSDRYENRQWSLEDILSSQEFQKWLIERQYEMSQPTGLERWAGFLSGAAPIAGILGKK